MRPAPLVLALFVTLAPLAAAAPPPDEADSTSVSCEPPNVAGRVTVLPCAVDAVVNVQFKVFVYFSQGSWGNVLVQAKGPGSELEIVCPVANTFAACVGPVSVGPAYAGRWTFTARPSVVDTNGNAYVKMLVAVD